MEKAITSAILTIAAVTASLVFINALLPRVTTGSSAVAGAASRLESRARTDLAIVYTSADTVNGQNYIHLWVKNIGDLSIDAVTSMDVFLSNTSGTTYFTYGTSSSQWKYTLLNGSGSSWTAASTIRIDLALSAPASGTYTAIVNTTNGAQAKQTFSV